MSIKKIAELAGVSTATVSNVLNGTGRVSETTAARVRELAQKQNLRLRPKQRNFSTKMRRIALAPSDELMNNHQAWFQMRLVQGIQSVLDRNNCSLTHSSKVTRDSIAQQTKGASAVILVGFNPDPEEMARAAGKPVIWALRNRCDAADIVQEDNREVGRIATEYLMARGHTRIGYLEDELVETVVERGRHMVDFVRDGGGTLTLVRGKGVFHRDDGGDGVDAPQVEKMVAKLFGGKTAPTGIFVPGDILCVAVYAALRRRGLEPGRDVDVLSCNNMEPYNRNLDPCPAVVDIEVERVGRRAAEVALWRLENPDEPFIRLLVRPELVLPGS